jgi:transposase
MIHIATQHRLHLWIEPIDFRKGLDALVGLCRQSLGSPYDGTVFAFRNKTGLRTGQKSYPSSIPGINA